MGAGGLGRAVEYLGHVGLGRPAGLVVVAQFQRGFDGLALALGKCGRRFLECSAEPPDFLDLDVEDLGHICEGTL